MAVNALMLDDVEIEIDGTSLKCLTNHIELSPDVTVETATTMCGVEDYPGAVKWVLRATFYQSYEDEGTYQVLRDALAVRGPVPYKIRPTSAPIGPENPSFEGMVRPQPFDLINGDAGTLSTVDIEWSLTGEPEEVTQAPAPPAPTVTAVAPNAGPENTATAVVITGTNLTGATGVDIGGPCSSVQVVSATTINATTPDDVDAGAQPVRVTLPSGTVTGPDFTYQP